MQANVTIKNEEGMHARPAGVFVKCANTFKSKVEIRFGESTKNGKSIMSILSLGLKHNSDITLIATGEDEKEALDALVELVNNKFQNSQWN